MTSKTYFHITGSIFLVIAVLHALRLLFGWTIVLVGWTVPVWFSLFGVLIAGFLSYTAFKLKAKAK